MSKFSTHWLPSPALSCVSVFHLYICLFWLTVLMHTPLPWNIQTCQGWTLTNGPQHGASNTDSWIHTCVCPCRHIWSSNIDVVFLPPLCDEAGSHSEPGASLLAGLQARNSPDPLVCLPTTEVTETRCQSRHTGAVELNLGPTLVQKTVSAESSSSPTFYFWGDCWCETKSQSILVSWSQGKPSGDNILGSPSLYPDNELPASLSLTIVA